MKRNALELLIPPPLLLLAAALLMWLVAVFITPARIEIPFRAVIGYSLLALGIVIDVISLLHFRRARTTFNPIKLDATSAVVTTGIYGLTRNPMYVGLTLVLLAWGIYLQNVLNVVVLVAFVVWLDRFQILPEEWVLESKFGETFRAYKRRVRRWV